MLTVVCPQVNPHVEAQVLADLVIEIGYRTIPVVDVHGSPANGRIAIGSNDQTVVRIDRVHLVVGDDLIKVDLLVCVMHIGIGAGAVRTGTSTLPQDA
jgi:hypothetical protein